MDDIVENNLFDFGFDDEVVSLEEDGVKGKGRVVDGGGVEFFFGVRFFVI